MRGNRDVLTELHLVFATSIPREVTTFHKSPKLRAEGLLSDFLKSGVARFGYVLSNNWFNSAWLNLMNA